MHISERGLKKPPPKLQEIIDLVNLPGSQYEFPRTIEFGVRYKLPEWFVPMPPHNPFELTREQYEQLRQGWYRTLRLQMDTYLPKAFADYLKNVMDHPETIDPGLDADEAVLLRCEELRRWRHNLRIIARRENLPIINESVIYFDYATGTKSEDKDALLVALDTLKEDGDIRYIRECLHCRAIYFAGRLFYKGRETLAACGAACLKAIHNKRHKARKKLAGQNKRPLRTDLVEAMRRTLSVKRIWPNFNQQNPEHIRLLAEQHDISIDECRSVLAHMTATKG